MEPKILPSLIILCILKISSELTTNTPKLTTSTPRAERGNCLLQKVTKGIVLDLINNYTKETTCTEQCRINETCAGVSWRPQSGSNHSDVGECRFKIFATVDNFEYLSLNSDDYSLSYCWKLNTSVHQPGGREQHNVTSETECQRRCIADCNCIGVDWTEEPENKDTRIQCWVLLSNAGKKTQTYKKKIRHWTIVRTEPRNCDGNRSNISNVEDETAENSTNEAPNVHSLDTIIFISLGALLGVWTLIIIGISIYALTLKKSCSTQKVVVEANVYNVDKVDENKVNGVEETKEEDDESYIDYQDLRRLDNAHTTYEEACEYTAMEVENMKDDDDVYCNEDQ